MNEKDFLSQLETKVKELRDINSDIEKILRDERGIVVKDEATIPTHVRRDAQPHQEAVKDSEVIVI